MLFMTRRMRHKQKQKGMDYSAEIPFEKQPAIGFYDTSEEAARNFRAPVGKTVRELDQKKPLEDEATKRKRDRAYIAALEAGIDDALEIASQPWYIASPLPRPSPSVDDISNAEVCLQDILARIHVLEQEQREMTEAHARERKTFGVRPLARAACSSSSHLPRL